MTRRAGIPQRGALLFFEGDVYEFVESRKAGHLTFGRAGKKERGEGYRTVTVSAAECERDTASSLVPAADAEFARVLRALPPDPDAERRKATTALLSANASAAKEALKAAGSKQLYYLEVDGEPDRLIAPAIERPSIRVKKQGGKNVAVGLHPGGLSIAQHPPK